MNGNSVKYFLRKRTWSVVFSSVLLIISALSNIYFAFVLAEIISSAIELDLSSFYGSAIKGSVVIFVGSIFQFYGNYIRRNYSYKAISEYKNYLLKSVLDDSLCGQSKNTEAYYINILNEEIDIIGENYFMQIPSVVHNISLILLVTISLIMISFKLFIVIVALFFITMLAPLFLAKKYSSQLGKVTKRNEFYLSYLKSIVGSLEMIKSFNLTQSIVRSFSDYSFKKEKSKYNLGMIEILRGEVSVISSFLVQIVVIITGVLLVFKGDITIAILFAVIQLIGILMGPISQIQIRLGWIKGAKSIITKHDKLLEAQTTNQTIKMKLLEDLRDIELSNINFKYSINNSNNSEVVRRVIKDLSIKFISGKKYAIIGRSGSGKTTLLKLIMGFLNDYEGRIEINGIDIRELDLVSYYKSISYMHQNVVLFEESFIQNIKLFREIDSLEIMKVLKLLGLEHLYKRYSNDNEKLSSDTIMRISGGEKQRIAIARVIAQKMRVVLFDEATSSLDPVSTQKVYDELINLKDLTLIAITHEWSDELLEKFDYVIYMDQGRIIETGEWLEISNKIRLK